MITVRHQPKILKSTVKNKQTKTNTTGAPIRGKGLSKNILKHWWRGKKKKKKQ